MIIDKYLFRIARSSGYKSTELESLQEGSTLCIGGKEIEVSSVFQLGNYVSRAWMKITLCYSSLPCLNKVLLLLLLLFSLS